MKSTDELNAEWRSLIEQEMERSGRDRVTATSKVAKRYPQLHKALVESANRDRPALRR